MTGRNPTYADYAAMWNGGPNGWKKPAARAYARDVVKIMAGQKETKISSGSKGNKKVKGTKNVRTGKKVHVHKKSVHR